MKNYILKFFGRFNYPKEARKSLLALYERVEKNKDFNNLLNMYYKDDSINIDKPEGPLGDICKKENLSFYSLKLMTYICLTKGLKKEYDKAGISEQIYYDTVEDLFYKMQECYEVYGQWGVFSPGWYNPVFHMKTFVLGRLAYNLGEYNDIDAKIAGRTITNGCKVINIHIPSSGKPFNKEARLESYALAADFFKEEFPDGYPVFKCDSWLLYEKNKEILGDKSNITSFINDFKMVISREKDDCSNFMWRIFGKHASLPSEELPEDTSMRRAYKQWLKKGNKLGGGMGIFMYDSINNTILND